MNAAARAAEIARNVVARHADDVDRDARFPEESITALASAGLFGLCVAESLGGAGQGPRAFAAVVEELAQACGSTAMVYVMHVTAARAIATSSTLADRDSILRDVAAGKHLTTLAFSEAGSRSQFWAPVSRLEESNGHYLTSASKSWVTSATHADSYVSTAQKPAAASPLESTIYFVRTSTKGVRVSSPFNGLGLRGNDSAPVTLEEIRVESGDLISPLGEGPKVILEVVLPWFAVGTAAMANGLSRAALQQTAKHLTDRKSTRLNSSHIQKSRMPSSA